MIAMLKMYKDLVKDVELTYLFTESMINTLIPHQNVEISNYLCFMSL